MTEQTGQVSLPELMRQVTNQMIEQGVPAPEMVSAMVGAAIDLSRSLLGNLATSNYFAKIAVMLDEELHFGE
ncbi:hypothetical protein ACFO0A_10435 [Novosphingobium tardum]|uniref:Uncharacterized protein n=1 Tax=Novosphingobium tardum TaxID=1538021 RepID=A0ABV8RTC6_9SPHN